jgi:hypothetical protein
MGCTHGWCVDCGGSVWVTGVLSGLLLATKIPLCSLRTLLDTRHPLLQHLTILRTHTIPPELISDVSCRSHRNRA